MKKHGVPEKNAYERVRGSPEESYNHLRKYGEALKLTNPGTIFHMELEDDVSSNILLWLLVHVSEGS